MSKKSPTQIIHSAWIEIHSSRSSSGVQVFWCYRTVSRSAQSSEPQLTDGQYFSKEQPYVGDLLTVHWPQASIIEDGVFETGKGCKVIVHVERFGKTVGMSVARFRGRENTRLSRITVTSRAYSSKSRQIRLSHALLPLNTSLKETILWIRPRISNRKILPMTLRQFPPSRKILNLRLQ